MKRIKIYLAAIFMLGIIVVACKKNDSAILGDDTSKAGERTKLKPKIKADIVPLDPNDPIEIQSLQALTGFDISSTPQPTNEIDAAIFVTPLMENSLQYFYDAGLSNSDLLEEFDSLDNASIAYAAIVLEAINSRGSGFDLCNDNNIWLKCLINMALPCSILNGSPLDDFRQNVIEWGFKEAFKRMPLSAKKTIITEIGKRAVSTFGGGALSLAIFVYDYASCIAANGPEPGVPVGATLVAIDFDSYLLPTPLPPIIPYLTNSTYLTNGQAETAAIVGTIFFSSTDNKYYLDSSFTVLVPDGYYKSPVLTIYPQYYHIVNGISIMAYSLEP